MTAKGGRWQAARRAGRRSMPSSCGAATCLPKPACLHVTRPSKTKRWQPRSGCGRAEMSSVLPTTVPARSVQAYRAAPVRRLAPPAAPTRPALEPLAPRPSYAFLQLGAAMTSQDSNTKPAAIAPQVRRQRAGNIVPMLVVLFAVLSAVALFVLDRDSGAPATKPNYRPHTPPAPQRAP